MDQVGLELQRSASAPKLGLSVCVTTLRSLLFLKADNLPVLKETEILNEKKTNFFSDRKCDLSKLQDPEILLHSLAYIAISLLKYLREKETYLEHPTSLSS